MLICCRRNLVFLHRLVRVSLLAFCRAPKKVVDRKLTWLIFSPSLLCLIGGLCFLFASESLGHLNIVYDPSSPFYFTLNFLVPETEGESDTSNIYLILAFLLALFAFSGLMPVRSLLPRLLFITAFTYLSAKSLEQVSFPFATEGSMFGLPWICCLLLTLFGTSTVLNASASATGNSGHWMMGIFVGSPLLFLLWIALDSSEVQHLSGVCFASSLSHILVSSCCRVVEFSRQHDPTYLSRSTNKTIIPFAESVCVICSCAGFFYGLIYSWLSRHAIVFDMMIPVLSLVFSTTTDGAIVNDLPSLGFAALISSLWWMGSALYSLFLKGRDGLQFLQQFESSSSIVFLFEDVDISVWNDQDQVIGKWITFLHLFLLILPLPGLYLSFLRRPKESEDLMFVLAILGVLSAIISQVWSIRLLGVTCALYSGWRCFDIGKNVRKSDQVI
jgi:hypothetical protein